MTVDRNEALLFGAVGFERILSVVFLGNGATETNPVARALLEVGGLTAFVLTGIGAAAAVAACYQDLQGTRYETAATIILGAGVTYYLGFGTILAFQVVVFDAAVTLTPGIFGNATLAVILGVLALYRRSLASAVFPRGWYDGAE